MSVEKTSYLLYGFKVMDKEEKEVFNKHYEDLMENDPYSEMFNNKNSNQAIVFDPMCGKQIYIGIRLGKINEYDEDSIEISNQDMNDVNMNLYQAIDKWPTYLKNMFKDVKPKLYFFINYY